MNKKKALEKPNISFKRLLFINFLSLILLIPASFTAWYMYNEGLPIDLTILFVGLSLPSLLLPALPKYYRVKIMKGGWPARVAFGMPGILMGILMIQFAIIELGKTPISQLLTVTFFGILMLFFGALLLIPNLTDTHSTED